MVTSLLTMAQIGLPVTWTLAPSFVYATFVVSCLILTAADITFSAVSGAVVSPEFVVKRNGHGLAAISSTFHNEDSNSPRRFSAHVSSRTLSSKSDHTYAGNSFKHASLEITGTWSVPVSSADIFHLERTERGDVSEIKNMGFKDAVGWKPMPPPLKSVFKFHPIEDDALEMTKFKAVDRRKEKDNYKQKYQDLLHRINLSLSRKRSILSEVVRTLTDADQYPRPAQFGAAALDRSLFNSLEIPDIKNSQLEINNNNNNSVVEAFPTPSRAWVVSDNVWGQSNPVLPMFGKGIMYSGAPSHGKRQARSVDNDTDEEKSEDVLLTEALHHIEDIRSQAAPCAETGEKIVLLKNMKLNPQHFHRFFADVVNKTVQMANTISDLLLFSDNPPESYMNVFYAMTQSLVETGPMVRGCAIAFNISQGAAPSSITTSPAKTDVSAPASTPGSSKRPYMGSLFPYSYRTREGEVVVTDLSKIYHFHRTAWFAFHANKSTDGLLKPRNRILTNKTDVGYLFPFINKWSKAVSVTAEDGFWAVPYYDCQLKNWVIQYSVPFYQQNGSVAEFKGVVLLEANFEAIPINQCAYDGGLFSGTHRCNKQSTECKNIPSSTLQWGSYQCVCKEGYTFPTPNTVNRHFDGRSVERAYLDFVRNISTNYSNEFNCIPMSTTPPSTTPLGGDGDPIVAFDFLVRGIPLGIQSFCMTVSLVIAIVILCFRKTKVMRTSIWVLLEMLLLGAILLYATVVLQYFEPTTTTCLLLPWLREMGFAIVYGVLVLKIYRILAEFQSRKAHRVHVRDKDLLKYLAVIMIVVIAYMSAWTAVNMDHLRNNSTILEKLYTKDRLAYTLCRAMWWDYVIEAGEFTFLCIGIYMCYCIRSAPTEYSEGRFITGAICYEAIVSTIFYILRHLWWYEMHPDHLFLMFFLRCQLTVTVVLLIILGPKLWYAHRPPDEDHGRSRAYSQSDVQDSSSPETMKLNVGISSNGDVEVGEISLTEMDPEDIRAELKRLYTQLQIYKTKTMRKDNPHISKRRGGRKQTHRRFSLQAFHHKHRHHHDHDHEHEMSKTPEESTNSAEAMAFTIEPSVKEDPNEGRSVPSVSFKPGHK